MTKRALVTGVTGQDGAYLAQLLLARGYKVFGCVRQNASSTLWRLRELGIDKDIEYVEFDLLEFSNILRVLRQTSPTEIYNLAAMSFVGASFEQPTIVSQTNAVGVVRLLEAIRDYDKSARFYQASTSEMFGKAQTMPQNETTPFYPRSPYGASKLMAHWMTVNYRESYGMFAVSGILFNHESPMRGEQFITRKVTLGLARIHLGRQDALYLGNLDAKRDWGHAADYTRGMYLMLQAETPSDYVLATNRSRTVRDFVHAAAARLGMSLAWEGRGVEESARDTKTGKVIVRVDPKFFRPAEVDVLMGDASRAERELGWKREYSFDDLVTEMVETDLRRERARAFA
jgi:GDPmannose 4,6-dehydratase